MTTLADVRETLSLNTGASNLVQPIIDRALFESTRKFTPLRHLLPRQTWLTNQYLFNKRSGYPQAQFTTEAPATTGTGAVVASDSVFSQAGFNIKHMQVQLDLSNFAVQIAKVNGNLVDLELEGAAKAMIYLEEMNHLYGSAGATMNTLRPQWDGFDPLLATASKIDGGNAVITLTMLDNAIDQIQSVLSSELLAGDYFFLVSSRMESAINRLFEQQTRYNKNMMVFTRDDYGIPDAPVVDNYMDGGVEVQSYRGIPIVKSSFIDSIGQMGTVTATDAGGSGSQLLAQAYYYVVEAVSDYGLTLASAEASVTPVAGHNVSLTWATPTVLDAFGNTRKILSYRIHRGNTTGTETLYALVSALDNTDTAIVSFTDTGAPINPVTTSTAYATTVAQSGNAAVPDGVTFPRIQANGQIVQDIFLLPRNPDICVVAAVNEMSTKMLAMVNARTQQLAMIADEVMALRGPAFGAKICRVRTV